MMIVKGLVCDTKLSHIIKENGFQGYATFQSKIEQISSLCDFFTIIEDTHNYMIVKLHRIIVEPTITELHDYPIKPSISDYLLIGDEEMGIRKIVLCEDGSIIVYTEKVIEENFSGSSIKDIKDGIVTSLKIKNSIDRKVKPRKKVFQLFGDDS
jgi:hypothetical protein